jgi:hypothetical protein
MSSQLSIVEGKKFNSAVDSYALSLSLGKQHKYTFYSSLGQNIDAVFSAWMLGNNCSADTFGIHCMSMWMHRSAKTLLGILPQASWLHNLSKLGNNSSHIETVLVLLCPLVDFVDVYSKHRAFGSSCFCILYCDNCDTSCNSLLCIVGACILCKEFSASPYFCQTIHCLRKQF